MANPLTPEVVRAVLAVLILLLVGFLAIIPNLLLSEAAEQAQRMRVALRSVRYHVTGQCQAPGVRVHTPAMCNVLILEALATVEGDLKEDQGENT